MKIGDLLRQLGGVGSGWKNDDRLDDYETRNKGLRSLRRQKRALVDDPREKAYLERVIKAEVRRRDRAYFRDNKVLNQKNFLAPVRGKKPRKFMTSKTRLLK